MNPEDTSYPDVLPLLYVLGDSISIQYGPYLEKYLRGQFRYSRKSGEEVALLNLDIAQGSNAGDSKRVVDFLSAKRADNGFCPDILLLNCGLHDIKREVAKGKPLQVEPDDYRANLIKAVGIIREIGSKPVWVRITPVADAIHNEREIQFYRHEADANAYNAIADEVMESLVVPMIDLNHFTRQLGPAEELFCDHVHFVETVREKQAAYIAGWLKGWVSSLKNSPDCAKRV